MQKRKPKPQKVRLGLSATIEVSISFELKSAFVWKQLEEKRHGHLFRSKSENNVFGSLVFAGCAIFYRKSKFSIVETRVDHLSEALMNEECLADVKAIIEENPKLMKRLTDRGTILQVCFSNSSKMHTMATMSMNV